MCIGGFIFSIRMNLNMRMTMTMRLIDYVVLSNVQIGILSQLL